MSPHPSSIVYLIRGWFCVVAILGIQLRPVSGATCVEAACVSVSGRLVSVSSERSVLLNAMMGQFLGSNVTISAVGWQALAEAQVSLGPVLQGLQTQIGAGSPDAALASAVSMAQLYQATASALQAQGNTAAANVFSTLAATAPSGSLVLGNLLNLCNTCMSYADVRLNALDLLSGSASLFNYHHALITPTPITLSGSSLGLGATFASVKISAQIVEPPRILCGTSGSTFHGAAIRLKLEMDLVDVNLSSALASKLTALGVSLPGGVAGLQAHLTQLTLYADLARVEGSLETIDAVAQIVAVEARPGAADLYLGTISDAVFFNRHRTLNEAADLQHGTVGSLQVSILGIPVTLAVRAKAFARGDAPVSDLLVFSGPYPQQQTTATGAGFAGTLGQTLLSSLSLQIDPSTAGLAGLAGSLLTNTVNLVKPALLAVHQTTLSPLLTTVVNSLLNPMLGLLGARLGEAEVAVSSVSRRCTYLVSGFAYRDLNRNGFKDTDEAGTGLGLYAKLFAEGDDSTAVQVQVVDPATGFYQFASVEAGRYRVRLDDTATASDSVPLTTPTGWRGAEQPTHARAGITVATADVPAQNFGLIPGTSLSGRVFLDTGAGGGTANDGASAAGEVGVGAVTLELRDNDNQLLDTALTTADGQFTLSVPVTVPDGTLLKVIETPPLSLETTGASVGTTGGIFDRASRTLRFMFVTGTNYTGVTIGHVPPAQWLADGRQTTTAGSTVTYAHTFVAGTAGTFEVAVTRQTDPELPGWTETFYHDADSDGVLDSEEPVLPSTVALQPGAKLAVILKVFVPVYAPAGARHVASLQARFIWSHTAGTRTELLSRQDVTTVMPSGAAAGLLLVKTVDKSRAKPGEVLEYTVTYTNQAARPLKNVVLHDATPSFSRLVGAGAGTLPSGITGVEIIAPAVGGTGEIAWRFAGALAPGAGGTVTFTVQIDP